VLEVEVIGAPAAAEGPREGEIRELCELCAGSRGVLDGHVAIEFVDASRIAELNARHRGKPEATDVLSFPIDIDAGAAEDGGRAGAPPRGDLAGHTPLELGDVVICPERTADVREAIVHGMLHLLGMDHERDDGEMLALQARLLAQHEP
jgi:probable rRNA maturation factor